MPSIPESVLGDLKSGETTLEQAAINAGFILRHRGKVRDTYADPNKPGWLYVVASDRISIFDFVLNATVPTKGELLTALTRFWLTEVLNSVMWPNHLINSLPPAPFPPFRTLVVRELEMHPYEMIVRHAIGGSVWAEYARDGTVAGVVMPEGLRKWEYLKEPIFTPSTKAEAGHDENITRSRYFSETNGIGVTYSKLLMEVYEVACKHALERGIVILDTKFEIGQAPPALADEILTPDSSRFTTRKDLQEAVSQGRDPIFYDKQPVRDWGAKLQTPFKNEAGAPIVGLKGLDPENEDHVNFVHSCSVPDEIIKQTCLRYFDIFTMLTGRALGLYQQTWIHSLQSE